MCSKAASGGFDDKADPLGPFGGNFERLLFIWIVLTVRFAETEARPAAVLVDEFDAGKLQGASDGEFVGNRH
jgi:hypothetical protein